MAFLSIFSASRRVVSPILQGLSFALLAAIPITFAVFGNLLTLNPIVIALTAIPALMVAVALPLAFGRPLGKLLSYPVSLIIATPLFTLTTIMQFLFSPITQKLKEIEESDHAGPQQKGNWLNACRANPPPLQTPIHQAGESKIVPHRGASGQNLYPDITELTMANNNP